MKFSIVVPVFNVEDYLADALNSILKQSFQDYQVVIINDGSSDGSLEIANDFCRRDSRFSVFSQENRGSSAARNKGVDLSSGEFVYFFDSDDLMANNALEAMSDVLDNKNCDVYFFGAEPFGELEDVGRKFEQYNRLPSQHVLNGPDYLAACLNSNFIVQPCCFVGRLDFLKKYKFEEGIFYEDNPYVFDILLAGKVKVYADNQKLFLRRIRSGSIMTSKVSIKNYKSMLKVVQLVDALDFSVCGDKSFKVRKWIIGRLLGDFLLISSKLPEITLATRFINLRTVMNSSAKFQFKRYVLGGVPEIYKIINI